MFRKLLVTGGVGLLAVSAFGSGARAQEVSRAPVPTTPTSEATGTSGAAATTSTTQPPTIVERSTADTGPHDYVGWVSIAGVVSIAAGISMRGRRADGRHYWR
jgi:hypothetical protein